MNRIVRAAGFAAAAVALVAGVSTSTPASAVESRSAASSPTVAVAVPAEAAKASAGATMTDPTLFQKMWSAVTALVTPGTEAVATAMPQPHSLAELVLSHAGVDTNGREQECLAKAVYFEARGEPIEGQLAVAEVVLNRAASGRYPTDVCAVITQPWQFSFIRRGRFPKADRGSDSWRKAVAIARIAQEKLADTLPADVLWYHATYVSPSWGKRLSRQSQIGLHIFYS